MTLLAQIQTRHLRIRRLCCDCTAHSNIFVLHVHFTGPGVDSASNRNEYQEYFLGVKAAGA